ncbi:MAG: class I SAM-dependent methyltransferase [Bacteriovoracaceae bacterium]|nr:class I SAM-dependent methyltransferase [Bacteriovoracaceae bacterium]
MLDEMNNNTLSEDDKHRLYESAVQCNEGDISFINFQYEAIYNKKPLSLREDFGGTGMLACEWVKQGPNHTSYGIDIDQGPIIYGQKHHYVKLSEEQKARMNYIEGDVMADYSFKSDVIVAFNFSYFIFKKRNELLEYFKKVRAGLNSDGAFFVDIFGGIEARQELVEETVHDEFSYFWDCDKYNPITNECLYKIHFKTADNKKHRDVFVYDWRMWGITEIREIMEDAGFSKTVTFWEGEGEDGTGDGNFYRTDEAENCESWVTYIVGLP